VEVVEEVGEQHQVVAGTEVNVEGAAVQGAVTIGDTGFVRVLLRDGEDRLPVHGDDFSLGIRLGNGDAEQAMPRGDVEDFHGASRRRFGQIGDELRGRHHERRHAASELNPHVVVGRYAVRVFRGAAATDGVGKTLEVLVRVRCSQKFCNGAHVSGRATIEKRGAVLGEAVAAVFLGEKTENNQVVGEDARAALGDLHAPGERRGRVAAFTDSGEQVKLDGSLESGGIFKSAKSAED